ncbi:MAG TPA: hypothetical protein VJ302_20245 [Blastocatellia bacterium]|nr:hypothetical protein [Blastocatellia bacterium]
MLLTPDHFLRQERYFDSSLLWVMRYASDSYGLVGAGARGKAAERGAARHDPVISVEDDGETLKVSVTQCRGISPSGEIIEIDPDNPLHRSFAKRDLEGAPELGIYVICEPHRKWVAEGVEDAVNPQIKSTRRQKYHLQLDVTAAEAPHSLMLSRVRKAEGSLHYEKVSGFIPVCTTLVSHSELKRAWDRLREQMVALADRYRQLHKAIVEYITIAGGRNLSTREDDETLQFVGRMVMSLETGIYDVIDPLQSPRRLFQNLYRLVRSAAVYLDLSPPTREYFRQLVEYGVAEFGTLLAQEQQTLTTNREMTIHDNLSVDVERIEQSFYRLRRLEEALEGKYMDYRVSTAIEALQFFFDRRSVPPALYESVARPARPQVTDSEMTFVFAPLRLDGRQSYRLILIRENQARFEIGDSIGTEVRINEGAGQGFTPIYNKAKCEVPDQRNFAIDFETPPEVHTITDLRLIVNSAWPIRSCLLYARRRIMQANPSRLAQAEPPPPPPLVKPAQSWQQEPPRSGATGPEEVPRPRVGPRLSRVDPEPREEPASKPPDTDPPVKRKRLS